MIVDRVKRAARNLQWRAGKCAAGVEDWAKDLVAVSAMHARTLRGTRHSDAPRPRLLMVDELVSDPRFGAGYPRAAQLLEAIVSSGWAVTFLPMQATVVEIEWMRKRFASQVRVLRGGGARALARVIATHVGDFDVVLVSRPDIALAFRNACSRSPAFLERTYFIYDAEALIAPRERIRRALFGDPFSASEYDAKLAGELSLLDGANAVVAVSPADARLLATHTESPVHVINLGPQDVAGTRPFDARRDFLFVGRLTGDRESSPNVDSLVWFVEEVMPLLDSTLVEPWRLHVVGIVDSPEVVRLQSDRVVLMGRVDDVRPLYDQCRVFIAPTRFAAGIPVKVIEAFGAGIPCVITPILADQLESLDGEAALVGSGACGFAASCAALYTSRPTWDRVRQAALDRIAIDFSAERFTRGVKALLDEAIAGRRRE